MFALVDGNNFYCSCERVFRPSLNGRPVIVLSNNDGCAIARSEEAKALGIKMGAPWFAIQQAFTQAGGVALSANFVLYGDMSRRMMQIAAQMGSEQEIYSIDETFIAIHGIAHATRRGRVIRERIARWTGLPSCVGIGQTKTLAKLANHVAKDAERKPGSYPIEFAHVCNLATLPASDFDAVLQATPVAEIWGVGRRIARQLNEAGVATALDLARLPPALVRSRWSVVLERTVRELQGQPCMDLEHVATKKQIACTRSFGQKIETLSPLIEAVTAFASRAAEKLRQQHSKASQVLVLIHTSPFEQEKQHSDSLVVPLLRPTDHTLELVNAAILGLRAIFKPGYRYARAGVMLLDLQDARAEQGELDFQAGTPNQRLMQAMDSLNVRFGKDTVRLASAGVPSQRQSWSMRQDHLSQRYTTSVDELPVAW